MIVHTKFSIGDRVWPIYQATEQVQRDCDRCKGKGELALVEGGALPCPNRYKGRDSCHGGKVTLGIVQPWTIQAGAIGAVGQVRVTRTTYSSPSYRADEGNVNEYMLYSTGVGSGRIWKESELFPSEEEAQAVCDQRNAVPAMAEDRANIEAGNSRRDMEERFNDATAPVEEAEVEA